MKKLKQKIKTKNKKRKQNTIFSDVENFLLFNIQSGFDHCI